jgi:hypothetical protein
VRFLPRIPRINTKRELWPGGPKVGEVIEAQLSPPPQAAAATDTGDDDAATPGAAERTAVDLLLLLR